MILRMIFKILGRILQVAIIAFFGYWLYEKLAVEGLAFAMLTLTTMPFMVGALILGFICSIFYCIKKTNLIMRIVNIVLLLAYAFALIYLAVMMFL